MARAENILLNADDPQLYTRRKRSIIVRIFLFILPFLLLVAAVIAMIAMGNLKDKPEDKAEAPLHRPCCYYCQRAITYTVAAQRVQSARRSKASALRDQCQQPKLAARSSYISPSFSRRRPI